jgi:hypothetical protein
MCRNGTGFSMSLRLTDGDEERCPGAFVAYASRRAVSRVVSTCPAVGMTADAARATKAIG